MAHRPFNSEREGTQPETQQLGQHGQLRQDQRQDHRQDPRLKQPLPPTPPQPPHGRTLAPPPLGEAQGLAAKPRPQAHGFGLIDEPGHSAHEGLPLGIREAGAAFMAEAASEFERENDEDISPYRDEQISDLFSTMGQASGFSSRQLAQQLQTSEKLITALEEGALGALPEWEQLAGVIANYASFMNVDERPILRRLREKLTEYHLSHLSKTPLDEGQAGPGMMPRSAHSLKAFAENRLTNLGEVTAGPEHLTVISPETVRQDDIAPLVEPRTSASFKRTPPPLPGEVQKARQNDAQLKQMMQAAGQQLQSYQQADQQQQASRLAEVAYSSYESDQARGYKKPFPYLKLVSNVAFVLILLIGFVHWQPNRFWSGVDQLPKPISKTIYSLFEYVMPDPLAATYRMNWVFVDDPRLRKADRLPVARVKALPPIDFSNLGSFTP